MDLAQILILFGWFFGLPGLAILQIRRARRKRVHEKECPECGLRSAAIPRFESRRPTYPAKALLGGILLAGWLGLTILMISLGSFRSSYQNRTANIARARSLQQTAAERMAEQQEGVEAGTRAPSPETTPD